MAKQSRKRRAKAPPEPPMRRAVRGPLRWMRRWLLRGLGAAVAVMLLLVLLFAFVNPPGGFYMLGEYRRTGAIEREWVPMESIAPVMARAAVAAEDANFCLHWGFDMNEIRHAIESGGTRGASTITQQTVKNVYLWHTRSWPRKSLEAVMTPMVELFWSKRRILEVYLNMAEFDDGVFGVEAAAAHYYGTSATNLTETQAARLAAILPNPKARNPASLTPQLQNRAAAIRDGAATIRADSRAACFED